MACFVKKPSLSFPIFILSSTGTRSPIPTPSSAAPIKTTIIFIENNNRYLTAKLNKEAYLCLKNINFILPLAMISGFFDSLKSKKHVG